VVPWKRMRLSHCLALVAGVAAVAGAVPPADASTIATDSYGFGGNQANGSDGRIARGGTPTSCATQTLFPGTFGTTSKFDYFRHTFRNYTREPVCVTVSVATACTGDADGIVSATYSPSFDSTSVGANWIADMGDYPPNQTQYSFPVTPEQQFVTATFEAGSNGNCGGANVTWTSDRPWARFRGFVSGVPAVGRTLTADTDVWADDPAVTRQWLRCDAAGNDCEAIPGATDVSYPVTDADVGHVLNLRETATENGMTSTSDWIPPPPAFVPISTFSDQTIGQGDPAHAGELNPLFLGSSCAAPKTAPATMGNEVFFNDLFDTTSLVNEPACLSVAMETHCAMGPLAVYSPAFAPETSLQQNYVADDGRTGRLSYTLAPGATTQTVATLEEPLQPFCSTYTLVIGAETPFATARPAVSGAAIQGLPMTTTEGEWSGSPAFARSWLRCDAAGDACEAIGGATGTTYTLAAADIGHRLRSRVTATQHGSASADSAPSEVIAADVTPPAFLAAALTNKVFAVDRRGVAEVIGARTRKRLKKGTTFLYTLSEDAKVTVAIQRCAKRKRGKRRARGCRYVRAGSFAIPSVAGPNRHRFSGRIGRRSLRPARYRAVLKATDGAANISAPKRLKFRVVRAARRR
jgi:hypothetical protein